MSVADRIREYMGMDQFVDDCRKLFDDNDADGTGSINQDELFSLLQDFWSKWTDQLKFPKYTEEDSAAILSEMDQDKDGELNFEEYEAFMRKTFEQIATTFE